MKIYWQVNIEYDAKHYPSWDLILEAHLGDSASAGLGFDKRDHQYDFTTEKEAIAFHKKAVKALKGKWFDIGDVERFEY